ncbi:MAG: hypothetical protein M1823_001904 [Watsoniomyces obsoletus]|nr:MAG: hypothetical protein M1823_001904 [Watsoniomyces obsoletus]
MTNITTRATRLLDRAPPSIFIRPFGICLQCRRRLSTSSTSPRNIHHRVTYSPLRLPSAIYHRTYSSSSQNPTTKRIQNYYDLFPHSLPSGPPPKGPFHIDTRQLRQEYLQLQSGAHPDRHPSSDRIKAEAMSTYINEAYKILQSPLLRAQYLLSLRGVDTAEDETAKTDDPELLTLVLEIREEMEEAKSEGDLIGLKKENDERIEMGVREIGNALEKDDLEKAKMETIKLRYWVNVKESLEAWEEGKEIVMHH